MAVIIAGCMRNGTSVTSNVLAHGGMYVGEHNDLDWRGKKDPEGIWENMNFVSVNNRILESHEGHWVNFNRVWKPHYYDWDEIMSKTPFENKIIPRSVKIIKHMQDTSSDVWGWKDPRNSLTLPYWHKVLGGMDESIKIVWCVRQPVESIDSMTSLGYAGQSDWHGFWNVWHSYNLSILNFTKSHPEIPVIVVKHEDWVNDTERQIRALFAFVGLDESNISKGMERVKPELYRFKAKRTLSSTLYSEILELSESLS